MLERQREGIAVARAQGVSKGRLRGTQEHKNEFFANRARLDTFREKIDSKLSSIKNPSVKETAELYQAIAPVKREVAPPSRDEALEKEIEEKIYSKLEEAMRTKGKLTADKAVSEGKKNLVEELADREPDILSLVPGIFKGLQEKIPTAQLEEVTVWEGPDCSATYRP